MSTPASVGATPSGSAAPEKTPLVGLFGLPNTGKTTVFNALTGSRFRTVNYPGTTVEYELGRITLEQNGEVRILDLPGVSNFTGNSPDEELTLDILFEESRHGRSDVYLAILDAAQIHRNLQMVKRLVDAGNPVIVVLTMVDLLEGRKKLSIDVRKLSEELGCPVVRIDKGSPAGIAQARKEIDLFLTRGVTYNPAKPGALNAAEIEERYESVNAIVEKVVLSRQRQGKTETLKCLHRADPLSELADRVFLHPVFGGLAFFGMMTLLFSSIFWVAAPLMDLVDKGFASLSTQVASALPETWPWLSGLLTDGIILGIGAIVVFLPQIAILFFILGLLEDSGYLARGALIVDRPLAAAGLSGRSFVPILSGFACAIPAMMAARNIPSRRERLLTIFILPLMLCSARLPVYGLLLAFLFPDNPFYSGLGLTIFYLLSVLSGLVGALIAGRFIKKAKNDPPSLLLQLPPIRCPKLKNVLVHTYHQTKNFFVNAGKIIIVISLVLWVTLHFPYDPGLTEQEQIAQSYASKVGQLLEPIMRPLGLDWRVGVALICAFAAREVFVSALALMLLVSTGDSVQANVLLAMSEATIGNTGDLLFTMSSCIGLSVFFVVAMQCMSTLAVSRKETGGWLMPAMQFTVFTVVAYLAAWIAVQGLRLVGVS